MTLKTTQRIPKYYGAGKAPQGQLTPLYGWETLDEQNLLRRYTKRVPENGHIVEIGSEYGMSASIFRGYSDDSVTVHCIDIDPRVIYKWLPHNLALMNLNYGIRLYCQDSGAMDWTRWAGGQEIDLLFIDGNHHEKYVLADLNNYAPHVRDGGYMVLHDCACETNHAPHPQHHEVMRAILSFMIQWHGSDSGYQWILIETVDTTMVYQKREL